MAFVWRKVAVAAIVKVHCLVRERLHIVAQGYRLRRHVVAVVYVVGLVAGPLERDAGVFVRLGVTQ